MTAIAPDFPVGPFVDPGEYSVEDKLNYCDQLAQGPSIIRASIDGLDESQLDTKYKNWTIRQIVHHLADSHMNAYVRYKWALTEASPLIKSYNETKWSDVIDAKTQPVEPSLNILEGLHSRWSQLIRDLDEKQMSLKYFHPEVMKEVSLAEALPSYIWHVDHHTGQIKWLRDQNGF